MKFRETIFMALAIFAKPPASLGQPALYRANIEKSLTVTLQSTRLGRCRTTQNEGVEAERSAPRVTDLKYGKRVDTERGKGLGQPITVVLHIRYLS